MVERRRAVVYVAVPDRQGVFEGRELVLGPRAGAYYVVEEGLREGEMVVVRPIRSKRAMTASPVDLPPVVLDELRQQILDLPGVSSLALDITSKPPGTIEWE